jgi:hypothetical protein
MRKTVVAFICIAALAAGMLLSLGVYRYAEAQAVASFYDAGVDVATNPAARMVIPEPTSDPGWFISHIRDLWRGGAITSGIILGLFGVLTILRKKVGWFAKGHQALIAAAALGTLTMLVGDIAAGNTPNLSMYLSAILAGVMLYIKTDVPEVKP